MLCQCDEDSRKKCDKYWPTKNSKLNLDELVVETLADDEIFENGLILREISVTMKSETRKIIQLHLTCWPDHSTPNESIGYSCIEIILSYIEEYRRKNTNAPVVIHCSAGLGRTGSLIALYNLISSMKLVKKHNTEDNLQAVFPFFSVFNCVRRLREERTGMVTSNVQYKFLYDFCYQWINRNFE